VSCISGRGCGGSAPAIWFLGLGRRQLQQARHPLPLLLLWLERWIKWEGLGGHRGQGQKGQFPPSPFAPIAHPAPMQAAAAHSAAAPPTRLFNARP
jgi:hypothetical protein